MGKSYPKIVKNCSKLQSIEDILTMPQQVNTETLSFLEMTLVTEERVSIFLMLTHMYSEVKAEEVISGSHLLRLLCAAS